MKNNLNSVVGISRQIIQVAFHLHQKNMLAAADGNISYRLNNNKILITPSGLPKYALKQNDFAIITKDNEIIKGKPSSERLMHLAVYQACAKAKCVIHAHPPKAIAWTIAKPHLNALPAECLSELILATGGIPIAPYARPGTEAMGAVLKPYLPKSRVILLARHGALTWGEDLQEALNGMERLEHTAEILLNATLLGGITNLSDEEVCILKQMRQNIGEKVL